MCGGIDTFSFYKVSWRTGRITWWGWILACWAAAYTLGLRWDYYPC
jgi:hypothetical protein